MQVLQKRTTYGRFDAALIPDLILGQLQVQVQVQVVLYWQQNAKLVLSQPPGSYSMLYVPSILHLLWSVWCGVWGVCMCFSARLRLLIRCSVGWMNSSCF